MSQSAAQMLAGELRRELGVEERFFDLEALLSAMEISVVYEKPQGRAEAMSLEYRGRDLILVDPGLARRRMRFTLAHELGHVLLGHGTRPCLAAEIRGQPKDPLEAEANAFGASLLLPTRLFREDIRKVRPRIAELSSLADLYGVSLTATAIRFVRFTDESCAVVGVHAADGPWIRKSDHCGWWLKLPPEEGTLAADHLRGTEGSSSATSPIGHWVEDASRFDGWRVTEDIVRTGSDSFLVVLSEFPDPDDEPDAIDREAAAALETRRASFRRY